MDQLRLGSLVAAQAGVVARRQVPAAGFDDAFIRKQVRRRLWTPVHPGVYVDHTGPPTWDQRAWAAVLHYSPAALCHGSALRAAGVRAAASMDDEPIHVAVEHPRKAVPVPGTRVHRLVKMHERVLWNTSPPRSPAGGSRPRCLRR